MDRRLIIPALALVTLLQVPPIKSDVIVVKKIIYVPTTVCPCEYNFDPVCGSNGVIYNNECLLQCASEGNERRHLTPIVRLDESQCTECACQRIYLPVCSLNGVTYPNECELSCENHKRIQQNESIIYLAYRKPCNGPPCGCPIEASPVCGTDKVLYRNKCVLDCASTNAHFNGDLSIAFKNVGACLNTCQCPDKSEPVCGSDTNVYDNLCKLKCQNKRNSYSKNPSITMANRKICNVCDCPSNFSPLCASDGVLEPKTYENSCYLECDAKRKRNPYLKKINDGPCTNCYCTDVYSPVCGTDNTTYQNLCKLRCTNKSLPKGQQTLDIYHYGECKNKF